MAAEVGAAVCAGRSPPYSCYLHTAPHTGACRLAPLAVLRRQGDAGTANKEGNDARWQAWHSVAELRAAIREGRSGGKGHKRCRAKAGRGWA